MISTADTNGLHEIFGIPEFRNFNSAHLAPAPSIDLAELNDFCINRSFERKEKSLFEGRYFANSNKA